MCFSPCREIEFQKLQDAKVLQSLDACETLTFLKKFVSESWRGKLLASVSRVRTLLWYFSKANETLRACISVVLAMHLIGSYWYSARSLSGLKFYLLMLCSLKSASKF